MFTRLSCEVCGGDRVRRVADPRATCTQVIPSLVGSTGSHRIKAGIAAFIAWAPSLASLGGGFGVTMEYLAMCTGEEQGGLSSINKERMDYRRRLARLAQRVAGSIETRRADGRRRPR